MLTEPQIRIVVPASNEESRIASTIREYCEHFEGRARIVVVVNGCEDSTEAVVLRLQQRYENLALISINARIGKGGAVRAGFLSGIESIVGFTDADGSTSAREFDRLITTLREFDADGVIGSRWMQGAVIQRRQPRVRRFASRIFNLTVRFFFGLPYRDTQCGAKVFRRAAIDKVFSRLEVSNFAFDVDLLYQLQRADCVVTEVPIAWAEAFNPSQLRLASASLSMLLAIIRLRLRDSLIAHIPLFEYISKRSVIPVRDSFRILVIGPERKHGSNLDRYIEALTNRWQETGHTVRWITASGMVSRLSVLAWYIFFGRREYDAVVEQASRFPYVIPSFSIKPRYVITAGPFGTLYRRWYGRVQKLILETLPEPNEQAAKIVKDIKSSGKYLALFDHEGGNWSITFTDMASRASRRQEL